MNQKVLWITRTALLTALLVVMQAVTAPLGNTLVTGSIVNLILIVAVMVCGPAVGLSVAAVSPVCAKLIGIGPHWMIVPVIVLGNMALVLVWDRLGRRSNRILTIAIAAVVKFLVLYIGVVRLVVPVVLQIPEPKASVLSGAFSLPQLFTASVGGVLAIMLLPVLEKAVRRS